MYFLEIFLKGNTRIAGDESPCLMIRAAEASVAGTSIWQNYLFATTSLDRVFSFRSSL